MEKIQIVVEVEVEDSWREKGFRPEDVAVKILEELLDGVDGCQVIGPRTGN